MSRPRLLSLLLALVLWFTRAPAMAADLAVTFFDIGQGDAVLITSPAGKQVLIDGGPPEGAEVLLQGLARKGVSVLDLIILTHQHLDHLGGLTKVVRALPVRNFLDAGFPHPSPAYTNLLKALAERGVPLRQASAGRKIDLGDGAMLTLLGPPSPYLQKTRSDVNANSVVARLTYRDLTALFPGDAEPETEAWLLGQRAPLTAQLLKVPHHGSKYASTAPFLQAVRPQIAVISAAARNDYGHPSPEALGRLGSAGARIYRTDLHGQVTVRSSDGKQWVVETSREATPALATSSPPPTHDPAMAAGPSAGTEGEFVASKRSDVFHRADCAALRQIRPENLLRFPSRKAALASGRRPAADCRP